MARNGTEDCWNIFCGTLCFLVCHIVVFVVIAFSFGLFYVCFMIPIDLYKSTMTSDEKG